MIYWRRYIEAFGRHTQGCSMLQRGAFSDLLDYYYLKEKPLPLDSDELARICRAINLEERAAVEAVLGRFFQARPDGYHNERADHEIAVSQSARENGSKGGRPTSTKTDEITEPETEVLTGSITETVTDANPGQGGGSGQPFSLSTKTSLSTTQPSSLSTKNLTPTLRAASPKGSAAWDSYSSAYLERYGTEPARNAKSNTHLARLVDRIGEADAPHVAKFYLSHNRALYVSSKHPTSLLERDAEGLRTEWATNTRVGETEARQADRAQATGSVFAKLLAEVAKPGT